jgi:zinc transport system substrate-binding protein
MSLSQFSILQILKNNHSFITVFLSLGILLSGCTSDSNGEESSVTQNSESASSTKITVSATIFPVYDIARQIAGNKAAVSLLLAPGDSPHTFNMTPSIQKQISDSVLIFGIGEGLDEWIVDSDNFIILSSGIELRGWDDEEHDEHDDEKHDDDDEEHDDHHGHDHSGADPHYWLAPLNGIQMAKNIADELKRVDPENTSDYEANLVKFTEEMESLQAELVDLAETVHDKAFITLHDSFAYFAEFFGLNLAGSFEPIGAEEPSPRYLKKLTDTVEEQNVKAIFSEPQLSTNSLTAFINDNNLQTNILDPLGGVEGRETYQALLKYNIRTLTSTLAK